MLNRLIPRGLKNSLLNLIRFELNNHKQVQKIEGLETTVKKIYKMVYDIYPAKFALTQEEVKSLRAYLKDNNFPINVNLDISKNDLMFHYLWYMARGDFLESYKSYLTSGFQGFEVVTKLVKHKFGNFKNVNSFLDFACGYGRLIRYLRLKMPGKKIFGSDIKLPARHFLQKEFGVKFIDSVFDPKDFKPNRKFDFIFVASLFSHLPEKLFSSWLKRLYDLTTPKGILVISVHDISLLPDNIQGENFVYRKTSEDKILEKVEDTIEDTEVYGTAYISTEKMHKILQNLKIKKKQYQRFKRALWGGQDLYVIEKQASNLTALKLMS